MVTNIVQATSRNEEVEKLRRNLSELGTFDSEQTSVKAAPQQVQLGR